MTADKSAAPGQWADQQRIQQEKEDKKERKQGSPPQQMTQGTREPDSCPGEANEAQPRRDQMQPKNNAKEG